MAQEEKFSDRLYSIKMYSIDGRETDFSKYKDKVLLIVNTASNCGFTGQYEDLETLYQKYKDKNFEILGFPSNDFAGQEPGNDEEIKKFCKLKFGVSFQLFRKSSVKGPNKNEVYKLLTEEGPEDFRGEVGWNFVKFLINSEGKVVGRFASIKNPLKISEEIEKAILAANSSR